MTTQAQQGLEEPPVDDESGDNEQQQKERQATTYVILQARALGEDEVFVVAAKRVASNGNSAKRAYVEEQLAEGNSLHGASLVAVPERSWEPEPVVIEQRIKIG